MKDLDESSAGKLPIETPRFLRVSRIQVISRTLWKRAYVPVREHNEAELPKSEPSEAYHLEIATFSNKELRRRLNRRLSEDFLERIREISEQSFTGEE